MGGKSSSTQQSQQHITDNRAVQGEGAIQATSGSVVNVLDNGAINRAFDTADRSLSSVAQAAKQVLDANNTNTGKVLDFSASTADLVKAAYEDAKGRGQYTDLMLMGAVAGSLLVAAAAVKGK